MIQTGSPQHFVKITEVRLEIIQKWSINNNNIEFKSYNAEIQPFTCTNLSEKTNVSLEASPVENMDTISTHNLQTLVLTKLDKQILILPC